MKNRKRNDIKHKENQRSPKFDFIIAGLEEMITLEVDERSPFFSAFNCALNENDNKEYYTDYADKIREEQMHVSDFQPFP